MNPAGSGAGVDVDAPEGNPSPADGGGPRATASKGAVQRFVVPILVGLGAFLVVAAVLTRFYAYPQLAVAPADQESITELEATDATIFDISTLSQITTDLAVTSKTTGDVVASQDAPDGVLVWVSATTVLKADGGQVSQSREIVAFDEHSAEAENCCGAAVSVTVDDEPEWQPVERDGLVFKFPFDTAQQDYEVWIGDINATATAEFVGEAEIEGLSVYEFNLVVPETITGTREVPPSILGLDGDEAVAADVTYSVDRTYYVEPVTGAVVNRIDRQLATLQYDGAELVTTDAEISYTDEQVTSMVDDIAPQASQLAMVRSTVPLIAGILGLLCLAGGAVLLLARRKGA